MATERRHFKPIHLLLALVALPLFALASCGDEDGEVSDRTPEPTRATATISSTPTKTTHDGDGDSPDDPAYPADRRTGIAAVDAAVDATIDVILSASPAGVQALIHPLPLACSTTPSGGIPQPPTCPSETDGTIIEAFPIGGPQGSYALAATAGAENFGALLESSPRIFAVFEVTGRESDPEWPQGAYGIVFVGEGQVRGVLVRVATTGIVRIDYGGGGTNPYRFTNPIDPPDFILPPLK